MLIYEVSLSIYKTYNSENIRFRENLDKRCKYRFANGVFDNGCIVTDVTPEVKAVKLSALLPVTHPN